jgi:hypothetical protein
MSELYPPTEADLAALADGSISPRDRESLLAHVRESPELSSALAQQEQAVAMTRALTTQAPADLHRRIDALTSRQRARSLRPRVLAGGALASAVAVVAALVISLSSSPHHRLGLTQIAALTLAPATMTAPSESSTHHAQLSVSVRGVPFPYWGEHFGWRSTGARIDHIAGRTVKTVFYESSGKQRIGYAILDGAGPSPNAGTVVNHDGVSFTLLTRSGVRSVTWTRAGHLCVVSGRSVSGATLLRLASWNDREAT